MYFTNILEYLEQGEPLHPDKTAFSDGNDSITFSQLLCQSKSIGSFLAEHGYYKEAVIVFMNKHPNVLPAFLGAVYAGCFYVAVDADMPIKRIESIIRSLKPRAVILDEKNYNKLDAVDEELEKYKFSDICNTPVNEALLDSIRKNQIDTDPIYVVFTSGSTGTPKGVVACHRSVIDYTETLCEAVGFDSDTVFGNQTPLYFDAPLKEIMPVLKLGCTAYFIPKQFFLFPIKLCDYLNEYKINTVCWVVSALTMISSLGALQKNPPLYLRLVCFGSEVFPIKQYNMWRQALPDTRFINLYGPTEATGMSCYWKAEREIKEGEPIPIGRPFRNTQILLIGEDGRKVKDGEPGEICIRGTCVTLGYYSNPEMTSKAFVQNPLNDSYPEPIYKTGDIGRYNEYGELVFVCRKDSQIKHMGHRIELGEIEAAVQSCTGVGRGCCVYDSDRKKIVVFYEGKCTDTELSAQLKAFLPRYMLPSKCIQEEKLPLTANGKLDRKQMSETAKRIVY